MEDHKKEVDLFYISNRAGEGFNRLVLELWKIIRFLRKTWYITLIVIAAGVAYGYYVQSSTAPAKEASILVRINFDAVDYVYTAVENLNAKFSEPDLVLSENKELNSELRKISALELEPVIDLKEVLDYYAPDDRRLENILRNGEFTFDEKDEEIPEITATFRTDYKYHRITLVANSSSTQATIDAIFTYINERPMIKELKEIGMAGVRERLDGTRQTIEQINKVMEKYQMEEEAIARGTSLFVVDNFDISEVFETKATLLRQLEVLNRDYVYAKDVVVNVSEGQLYERHGFIKNKLVYFGLIFLVLYLILAFVRYMYLGVKRVAIETERELSSR